MNSDDEYDEDKPSYKKVIGIYEVEYESAGSIGDIFNSIQNVLNPIGSFVKWIDKVTEYMPFFLKLVSNSTGNLSLLLLWAASQVISTFIPSIELYYTSELFRLAEEALEHRTIDQFEFYMIIIKFFIITTVGVMTRWKMTSTEAQLSASISRDLTVKYLASHLNMSVGNMDDPETQKLDFDSRSFGGPPRNLVEFSQFTSGLTSGLVVISLVTQGFVLYRVTGKDDLIYVVLAVISYYVSRGNLNSIFNGKILWTKIISKEYLKMGKLMEIGTSIEMKTEVERLNLKDYIVPEYIRVRDAVGTRAVEAPGEMIGEYPLQTILITVIDTLPMIHFVLRAINSPSSTIMSLSSLALVKNTTSSVVRGLDSINYLAEDFEYQLTSLKNLFAVENVKSEMIDGDLKRVVTGKGMAVEFKNVSFTYPGREIALKNINWKLGKGQLMIIVGLNGSGKSTLLKLLSRLYDPMSDSRHGSGAVLVDGIDLKEYKIRDIRRAQAVGSQDYVHFPLSIAENIALGNIDIPFSQELAEEAAKLAGAHEFISRLSKGYATDLNSSGNDFGWGIKESRMDEEDLDRYRVNRFSQGQYQKLALARTLFRSMTAGSDLMVFDEPSASLDGKAEFELFAGLDALRKKNKSTVIYVSHRLGGFLKSADLVLYMDGSVILEQGTHADLMKRRGKYYELYTMQSSSFQE